MDFWRVSPARTLEEACRGEKAGRWSWASREVLYASITPELAVLEALVHRVDHPVTHWLCRIQLPRLDQASRLRGLAPDWKRQPALTRRIGNDWFDRRASAALLVPSAVCEEGANVLVNPRHPHARGLRMVVVRRFEFDRRLSRPH